MLTGYQLAFMSRENVASYVAGTDATTGLQFTPIPCPSEGGRLISIDWATPCSNNGGVSLTGFDYSKAINSTKPRPDAVKVITVQDNKNGGTYGRWIVPDTYTQADFITACCAGCDPLPSVTVTDPILFGGECTLAAPTLPGCVYKGGLVLPALGGNTTYTVTGYGLNSDGVAVVFAPTTSVGTTPALLAADMQTNWASEMGSGTFTASGLTINWTGTTVAKFDFTVALS